VPTSDTVLVFAVAAVTLLVIPGPSVLYIVAQSAAHGRSRGLVGMLGVQAGGLVHVVAASFGLSAVLASSATAFSVVKYAGAAYLVWLGLTRLRAGDRTVDASAGRPGVSPARVFRQGLVVNLLNPKTALFFLAVLPQFVDPARGTPWLQSLTLGALFITIAVVTDGAYALSAGWLADRLRSRAALTTERYATSAVLVGLGVAAALTDAPG
jgi:threonine/homoserine/homoserine lactone efflux protein